LVIIIFYNKTLCYVLEAQNTSFVHLLSQFTTIIPLHASK